MKFLSLEKNQRFSNKQIIAFFIPVIFETLIVAFLSTIDTLMVSSLGETSVAGVALINRLDNFAKQFFVSLAQGGSVVIAQYIGAVNKEMSENSLKHNIRIVTLIGFVFAVLMLIFKNNIVDLFFGKAEADVLAISHEYFGITALSYPFCALYYSCTNAFRAMGESRVPFISALTMIIINIVLKYIFIFKIKIGVYGAGLSTLISFMFVGLVLLCMLKRKSNKVVLKGLLSSRFDFKISKRILGISVPNGIEQGMFQLGNLAIAGLVSSLGTSAIAADQITRNITPLIYSISSSFSAVMLMVIGQYMGAGNLKEVKFYKNHILKLNYLFVIIASIIFVIIIKPLLSMFNVSDEAKNLAYVIAMLYTLFSCMFYPTSFVLPAALRATGDTKFVMVAAITSMFLFRIASAYIFVYVFKMGIVGTWLAMVSDWVVRTVIFSIRYKKGKWAQNRVI